MSEENKGLPRVVIIGGGFAGLTAAKKLDKQPVQITLIDKHNYHLFQPLLYQVATSGLSPEDVAHPIRPILKDQKNITFLNAEVLSVDREKKVITTSVNTVEYDYLVVAVGGDNNFFGNANVEKNGHGLKNLHEAVELRNHVLSIFEGANHEKDATARRCYLNFVVVGGGPTGVEYAGALSELIYGILDKDFPQLDLKEVRIILLEGGGALLPPFPESLREETAKTLWNKHVEVRFHAQVTDYDGERVFLKTGEIIPTRTLVWAAGIRAERLIRTMNLPTGPQGRAVVTPTLQLEGHDEIFIIGDCALAMGDNGRPLPTTALVALQEGEYVAAALKQIIRQKPIGKPFKFKDYGSMATIGRNDAVVAIGNMKFKGFIGWFMWIFVHIFRLVGFRNRIFVFWKWFIDYFTYEKAVRIITKE